MELPLVLKIVFTLFVLVLVPVYARYYGPANFLWFSDIALLTTCAALWLESSLLVSMQALAIVALDGMWCVDFLARAVFGVRLTDASAYMFQDRRPIAIRALSLFHLVMPPLVVWLVAVLGYDRRALLWQTAVCWIVLMASYFWTKPKDNVNWVFGPYGKPQQRISPRLYLAIEMLAIPLVVYVPTHFILAALVGEPG